MYITVGTAGHIDHGKTLLIKALTGTDADRLPEEKQRGISIDLGFAELELDGVRIGFVDVPGHERFVKNMLAGASGIDLVLFVIAADEGVMPQTKEHFEICRLLGIKKGIVVLTKTDMADSDLLEMARLEAAELVEGSFLDGAPVIAVSSKTGDGIDDLKLALIETANTVETRDSLLITRLPIDRSFTVKGFGTVVTGTLASGKISLADEMELLPGGQKVRVRGIQVHGKEAETVTAGQRAAVNLGGIDYSEVVRGMILAERGVLRTTQIIDAVIEALKGSKKAIRSRQRVRLHIGTREVLARIVVMNDAGEIEQGGKGFIQLRLEAPVAAIPGERFIIRSYSPSATIGGGQVLDGLAAKVRKKDLTKTVLFLESIANKEISPAQTVALWVNAAGENGMGLIDLQARTGWQTGLLQEEILFNETEGSLVKTGGLYLGSTVFEGLKAKANFAISEYFRQQPLSSGMPLESLREQIFSYISPDIFKTLIADLEKQKVIVTNKELVQIVGRDVELSGDDSELRNRLLKIYLDAGIEPPKLEDALAESIKDRKISRNQARAVFQLLLDAGEIVKVTEEFYFPSAVIGDLIEKLTKFATGSRLINVIKFKEIAGISRKYAIPLLEYFDREKVTMRVGDQRQIL